jgi:hypothetical protein
MNRHTVVILIFPKKHPPFAPCGYTQLPLIRIGTYVSYVDSDSFGTFGTFISRYLDSIELPSVKLVTSHSRLPRSPWNNTADSTRERVSSWEHRTLRVARSDRSQPSFHVRTLSFNDDPTSSSVQDGPRCGLPTRPGDYMCYKHVSFWSTTLMTTEACVGNSFWTGTPVGTSSSIGQRVVVLETGAEGGGGGGGGGEITTSGSPARSQSNLQRIFSGWSPPK